MAERIPGQGAVVVSSYDDKGALEKGILTSHQMLLAVYSGKPGTDSARMLQEGKGARWQVSGLAAGKYYLQVNGWDDHGKKSTSETLVYPFSVEAGQSTAINLVITDYLKSSMAVGGAVVGTVTVATVVFSVVLVLALIAAI